MFNSRHLMFAAASVLAVFTATASAATLTGQHVDFDKVYRNGSTVINFGHSSSIVGSGVEFGESVLGTYSSIDVSSNQITVLRSIGASAADFNGDVLYFPNLILTSVTVSQLPGDLFGAVFTADRVTFDANHVYINYQGGNFTTYLTGAMIPSPLILDVTAETPEPASAALVALAGAALFAMKRKQA